MNWDWLDSSVEKDEDCHLMVQCMENWLVASSGTLKIGAKNVRIRADQSEVNEPEKVSKLRAYKLLNDAYKAAGQRGYSKGDHSFTLLEKVDVGKLCSTSPWARRFFTEVAKRCQ